MGHRAGRYRISLVCAVVGAAIVSATASATDVRRVTLGSSLTMTGQTASLPGRSARATGLVAVVKSWAGDPTLFHTWARTDSKGRYRVTMTPPRRGFLTVVITPPDKHPVRYLFRVV